jgi:hypothetical protein
MSKTDKLKQRLENIESLVSNQLRPVHNFSKVDSKFSLYLSQCEQGWKSLRGLKNGLMPKYVRIMPKQDLTFDNLEEQIRAIFDKMSHEPIVFYTSHHNQESEMKWMLHFLTDLRRSQMSWKNLLIGCKSLGVIVHSHAAKIDLIFAEDLPSSQVQLFERFLQSHPSFHGILLANKTKRHLSIELSIDEVKITSDYRLSGEVSQ